MLITNGEIIFPRIIPNLNQSLFNGVKSFEFINPKIKKTKEMNKILKKFEANNSLIILDKNSKEKVFKSLRNLPNVKTTDINHFSAFDIIKFKKVIFTETSVKELEKRYE